MTCDRHPGPDPGSHSYKMAFFKRHTKRGSYDLFSTYNHYLPDLWGMAILFGLFFVGSLLGSLVSGLFVLMMGPAENIMSYSMLISYPISFIPPLLYASAVSRRNEYFEKGYALDNNNFGQKGGAVMAIVVSIATIAMAFVIEPVALLLPEMPENLKTALEAMTNGPIVVSLLSVSVMAPLFEEWLCRGLVLRGLMKKMNPAWAIVVSAAFFAVLHMNPWQAVAAFALGLLFGYVYYRTGSLKLTMLMHCVNNTFSVLISRVPDFKDAESFMDILSPWAYAGVYVSCVLMIACALIIIKAVPARDDRMGGCEEVDSLQIN